MIPHRCLVIVNVISGGAFIFVIKRRCDEDSRGKVFRYKVLLDSSVQPKKDAWCTILRRVFIYTSESYSINLSVVTFGLDLALDILCG
jgi:hypothetical protein